VPMVVLVNGASASASRSLPRAADAQAGDCDGSADLSAKGSVQTIIPLRFRRRARRRSAHLPPATTPRARSIQAKGIEPDCRWPTPRRVASAACRSARPTWTRHLEEKTGAPAAGGAGRDARRRTMGRARRRAESPAPRRYEFGAPEDFQLQQALNHLKGLPVETAKSRITSPPRPALER